MNVSVCYVCYMRHSLMYSLSTFEVKANFCCLSNISLAYFHCF
jgi:hypothetical protein